MSRNSRKKYGVRAWRKKTVERDKYLDSLCKKRSFRTVSAAERALESAQAARDAGEWWREEIDYYKCPVCTRLHLTSKKQVKKERKSAKEFSDG